MVAPQCTKCGKPIGHGHLQFEDALPVHKACWGVTPERPKLEPFSRTPMMDMEEFVGRVTIAMTVLLLAAFVLL